MALETFDVVAMAILAIATLRGLAIGVIRELFSLAALAAAVVVVRLFTLPLADWLLEATRIEMGELAARVAAGAILAVATIAVVGIAGRILRGGIRAVGLGFADRLAGGVLGAAEGAVVAIVLLVVAIAVAGRDHPLLVDTRTLAVYDSLDSVSGDYEPSDVAAPPR